MKGFIIVLVLGLFIVASVFAFKGPRPELKTETLPSEMDSLRVEHREDGSLSWLLESERASFSQGGESAELTQVRLTLPDRSIFVNADSGLYGIENGSLHLSGNIIADVSGYTIRTNSATLLEGRELLSDEVVIIEGKGVRIEGKGLRTKQDKVVLKDVKAIVY